VGDKVKFWEVYEVDYREKEEKLFREVQKLKDGNQESYNEVYSLSADYVYKMIYELTQDVDASNEIINQVYSDIYYGISGLTAPEYFYVWAGQIATTDTLRYLISQGRMEIPGDDNPDTSYQTPVGRQVTSGGKSDQDSISGTGEYDGTTVGYSEMVENTGVTGYDGATVGYSEMVENTGVTGYDGTTVNYSEAADYTTPGAPATYGSIAENGKTYSNTAGFSAGSSGAKWQAVNATDAVVQSAGTATGKMLPAYDYDDVAEHYSEDGERFIPDSILTDTEKQRLIKEYLEGLTPFEKAIVQCYFYEAMAVSDIAGAIGCDKTIVKKALYNVKSGLKVLLGTNDTAFAESNPDVQLYDMASLPIIWLIFQSSLTNIPVSTLMARTAAATGAAAYGVAAGGAAIGDMAAVSGAATVAEAVVGNGIAGEAAVGSGIAGGAVAASGTVAAGAGIATGIKVAIAIGVTALIGGGAVAVKHFVAKDKTAAEASTEIVAEETTEEATEASAEVSTETTTEATEEATTETTTEVTTEATTEEAALEKTAEELNAESIAAYQEFLAGERMAVVMDQEWYSTENEYADLTSGESVSISDFDKKYIVKDSPGYGGDDFRYVRYYRYIDVANDDVSELEIRYKYVEYFDGNERELEDKYVYIKYMDDNLFVFYDDSYESETGGGSSTNIYGKVIGSNPGGGSEQIFDSNCNRHNIYTYLRYEDYTSSEKNIDNMDTIEQIMNDEFERAWVTLDYFRIYEINGEEYSCFEDEACREVWQEDSTEEGAAMISRFKELLDEYSVEYLTSDEIEKIIEAEEEKYVPNGIPNEYEEPDWVEF
jgi:DNA-directed RNA polymerase specialized sigma24 family protein